MRLTLTDNCNEFASVARIIELDDGPVSICQDALRVNGVAVAVRCDPHGLGDVHWQLADGSSADRWTDIGIEP